MIIRVKNLSKKFKENEVIKNVNLTFESGKIYGLIGRNGSGKSVFLKLLCGFYKPTSGQILYDKIDINKSDCFAPNTRALIENPCFLPDLTGFENLKLLASIQNKIDDEQINIILKKLNLENEKNKKYSKYSLGTKQKLAVAQVLMENPEVIILDEPLNGVENITANMIRKILKEERDKGKIILIATHIKDDINELVDELYEFDNGMCNLVK